MIHWLFKRRGMFALLLVFGLGNATDAWAQGLGGGGGTRSTRSGSSGSTRQYNPNGMIGDAMISYDPETRRIIVVTDEDTNLAISQVITNLDRPKPQVLIKVVFLEVTRNDGSDLGVEGSYSHKISNTTTGTLSTAFGLAQQLAPITGGGLYKVLSDDFEVTLHAIATAGKTEVLSRPSILARNSQAATIVVGQSIPLITGTRVDSFGNQINSISYSDIGIILRVTPFITEDGLVEMIVSPEISNLTDQTVPIASNVSAPVIAKRSADTVVVTPDGKPVIIGGLMENRQIDTTQKVPVLGDIPLLGFAFRRNIKAMSKTELIIILTPRIVRLPNELMAMTMREKDQTVMAPKSFSEAELDRFIDGLPVKQTTVPAGSSTTKKSSSKSKKTSSQPTGRGLD